KVLYTGNSVIDVCFRAEPNELIDRLNRLSGIILWRRLRGPLRSILLAQRDIGVAAVVETLRRLVQEETAQQNNMNLYNLFMLELCDYPFLKKDLVFRDQYSVGQIEDVVEAWTGADREHV